MKYLLINAKLSINGKETWIRYIPLKDFIRTDKEKGFHILSLLNTKLEKDIINDLNLEWFLKPVEIQFRSDTKIPSLKYITRIKLDDKVIK